MTQTNSSDKKPAGGTGIVGALQRLFCINVPATMVLSATLAVVFAVALDGCSKHNENKQAVSTHSPSQPSGPSLSSPLPTPTPVNEAVTPKKKPVVKRSSTISYKEDNYGVSFRYPRKYTLMTPEKAKQNADMLEWIPMNFVQPGGSTVATIELPSGSAISFFNVNVNKGLSADECSKFADPAPTQTDSNSPVSTDDGSVPSKVEINGMEFSKVDSATEQLDTRYYHRFENGVCYEFAMGVEESPDTTKPVDHLDVFDKLERILATVKIKPERESSVTASVPQTPTTESKPQ